MASFCEVDTKLEAYNLVHDPTKLLSLLYLKYGDIEEDYYLYYSNKLVYNIPSHFNSIFKELHINNYIDEFLKRRYKTKEAKERIPKLSEYYKNYLLFFCKPTFRNFYIHKLMYKYEERKAEVFYKDNYADENSKNEETKKEVIEKCQSSSLSSLDNITDNKIIFTKFNRKIIDNNLNSSMCTLTFTLDSIKKNNNSNNCIISERSLGDSFEKILLNFINYQNKKIEKKDKKRKVPKDNGKKNYSSYIKNKKQKIISQLSNKNMNNKTSNKIKNSFYILERKNYSTNKNNSVKAKIKKKSHSKNNIFFSAKLDNNIFSKISSKFEEFNKIVQSNLPINNQNRKNKSYNVNNQMSSLNSKKHSNNNNATKTGKNKELTNNNISNFKDFSKLSKLLNNHKINLMNSKNFYSNSNSQNTIKKKGGLNPKKSSKENINKNDDQYLTVNNEPTNNYHKNIENLKKKHNKTFDLNIKGNNQKISNKLSPNISGINFNMNNNKSNFKIINISKNNQKSNFYRGSNFNLVKGSIINIIKKPQSSNNQNLLNKINNNYSSNYNHYKNNSLKQNNNKNKNLFSNASTSLQRFNLMHSKGEKIGVDNHKSSTNDNKLYYLSNNINGNNNEKKIDNNIENKEQNKNNNVSYTNNNFNINFNNVFFCSQRIFSVSSDKNYNSSINQTKNNNNKVKNGINKNNNLTQNNNNSINNIMKNLNSNIYLSSLKNIYNFSRNKLKINNALLTQNKTGNVNHKSKSKSNNKNSKDKNNNYNSYYSNNIPMNQKKYIVKENNFIENRDKKNIKVDLGHKIANQIDELIKKSHKVNFNKKQDNINKEQIIIDKKSSVDDNLKNENKNRKSYSITSSVRSGVKTNKNDKNLNLTSKNNSKVKHKKRISNYI